VEDDEGGVGRCLGEQCREVGSQVAGPDVHRFGARQADRGVQVRPQVLLPGPHEGVEPGDVGGVVDVERVQVEAGAPRDLDRGAGQRCARTGRAPEGRHVGRARRRHAVAP
jgi:hypothetical protein